MKVKAGGATAAQGLARETHAMSKVLSLHMYVIISVKSVCAGPAVDAAANMRATYLACSGLLNPDLLRLLLPRTRVLVIRPCLSTGTPPPAACRPPQLKVLLQDPQSLTWGSATTAFVVPCLQDDYLGNTALSGYGDPQLARG